MQQEKQHHGRLARLQQWVRSHRVILLSIGGVILVAGITIVVFAIMYQKPVEVPAQTIAPEVTEAPEPVKYYSPLSGSEVKSEKLTTQAVTAIMIENSPDARPQSGLRDSGVVFEAIAEGGITRFLALYQQEKPKLVGPVRSLRMYYVDWLSAFDASIAHVGGSAKALALVRNGTYRDIDQFFNSGSYWRATDRYAPHNVYTSFERLDALNKSKGYTSSEFTGFSRKDSTAIETPTAKTINVTISGPLYDSSYAYNAKTNTYDRSQGGERHIDRESDRIISPRVVVVLEVDMELVMEDGYRESIKTIGKGKAYVFQDGDVSQLTWNKKSRDGQITFTNKAGDDVPLARGQTWITAIPNGSGDVTWK